MTGRALILVTALAGVGALALTFGWGALPLYVWNASASVPVGLYRLQSTGEPYRLKFFETPPCCAQHRSPDRHQNR